MASTNKTTNFELSQYVGSDKPTYLGDYNSDMNKIDTAMQVNKTKSESNETAIQGLNGRAGDLENNVDTINEEITNINSLLTGLLPIGTIVPFAGSTIPEKWLECDGSAISRETYDDLYNVISVDYGVGDGATTFNIPNLKGRIPVGHNPAETEFDVIAKTGGEKTHLLTVNEMPSHTHQVANSYNNVSFGQQFAAMSNNAGIQTPTNSLPTGGDQHHNNLQPYIVMKYIIKAQA